jgi:sialate O-acetylesterase
MVLPMRRVRDLYEDEIAASGNPQIRYFFVPLQYDFNGLKEDFLSGEWKSANPENVLQFSAAAYFFAKTIYDRIHVPIGIVNASVGGTPIEAWMSEEALRDFPAQLEVLERYKDDGYVREIIRKDRARIDAWYARLRKSDEGYSNQESSWFDPATDVSDWRTMRVPAFWADEGFDPVNGVFWFKKEIDLPASMAGKSARLNMGRIVDADSVYVNGAFVGTTSYQYPPRIYWIPEGILKSGKNVIVVRIINSLGKGGFIKDKPYELIAEGDTVDLKGEWRMKPGANMDSLGEQIFVHYTPAGLYNGMIHPLLKTAMKGVLWYQGESNTERPKEYADLFPALIRDWREQWKQGEFPFLYVQLPNYLEAKSQPDESNNAELREAQSKALILPNTAMAVTVDIGEWNDIHPLNKRDVGQRLALTAQNRVYGMKDVVCSGPLYESMEKKGNKIILTFSHVGGGLIARGGGPLRHFAIAGRDGKFVWADAEIVDDKVIVWNNSIADPVAVRYAWADNPEGANLYNREGLPASPFRTNAQ